MENTKKAAPKKKEAADRGNYFTSPGIKMPIAGKIEWTEPTPEELADRKEKEREEMRFYAEIIKDIVVSGAKAYAEAKRPPQSETIQNPVTLISDAANAIAAACNANNIPLENISTVLATMANEKVLPHLKSRNRFD